MLAYYTGDGSQELGSETFGLVTYHSLVKIIGNVSTGKVNNATMSLIIIVFILRYIGKSCFPQSESISGKKLLASDLSFRKGFTSLLRIKRSDCDEEQEIFSSKTIDYLQGDLLDPRPLDQLLLLK